MARADASLITLVAAAIAVAGCGAGSGLSRAALDSKANAICADEATARDAIPQPSNIADATQAAAYFDQTVPILSDASGLADLKAEPALGTKVDDAATRIGATRCAE